EAARAAVAARPRAAAADRARLGWGGEAARAAARADGRDARATRPDRLGADARRLPDDEPLRRRAPARADAPASPAGHAVDRGAARTPERRERRRRRDGRRTPAAGDR